MDLIIDLQYFASVILYKNSNSFSNIVFEQYEYYQKMSFRNRCQVAGAEGVINLSIPLQKGRDQKTLVKDVRIADREDWQGQHWKTIVSCYSRSPWFEFYRDELGDLYRRPFPFLLDWNLACFQWSLKILQMPVSFSLTTAYYKNYAEENWADWRGKILPKNQTGAPRFTPNPDGHNRTEPDRSITNLDGLSRKNSDRFTPNPDGLNRTEPDRFIPNPEGLNRTGAGAFSKANSAGFNPSGEEENLRQLNPTDPDGHAHDASAPVKYRQVFEERTGFLPNLSILDLLFCEGKNARFLLQNRAPEPLGKRP